MISIYFNDRWAHIFANMVWPKGPTYLIGEKVNKTEVNNIEQMAQSIESIIWATPTIISDTDYFNQQWIKAWSRNWIKCIGEKSYKKVWQDYKLVNVIATVDSTSSIIIFQSNKREKNKGYLPTGAIEVIDFNDKNLVKDVLIKSLAASE